MEVMVAVPLSDAHRAIDGVTRVRRLLALDDLWTTALADSVREDDIPTLVSVAEEMIQILRKTRDEVPFYRSMISNDPKAYEKAIGRALAAVNEAMGMPVTSAIEAEYGTSGWAGEIDRAFRMLGDSEPVEDELSEKLAEIRTRGTAMGDLPRWWKCDAVLGLFGLAVGASVLSPPVAPLVLAMQLGGECLGLAISLPGCGGPARVAPAEA